MRPPQDACYREDPSGEPPRHVHEVLGSVRIAEQSEDPHNHRFAGVSDQAIQLPGGSHVHEVEIRTDFYEDHFHFIRGRSGPAIPLCDGRHVHYLSGETSVSDGHDHGFIAASLINDPIGE